MASHVYLRKANNDLVSHCRCSIADALISSPGQMDCPWCGCGWLFICSRCRKAFTFAEAFACDEPIEEIAVRSLFSSFCRAPTPLEREEWIELMEILLKGIQVGHRYVYLDGYVVETQEPGLRFEGWHSHHDLDFVPQVAALRDPTISSRFLESVGYWRSTAIEDNEG